METYNIAVLGAPKTGKKTFVGCFSTSVNLNIYTTHINTNYGEIIINFYVGLELNKNVNFDAVILLFDAADRGSIIFIYELELPKIPIMLCPNKIDLGPSSVIERSNHVFHYLNKTHNVICEFTNSKKVDHAVNSVLRLIKKLKYKDDLFFNPKQITKKIEVPEKLYEKMKSIYTSDKLNLTIEELLQFHTEMKSLF